MPTWPAITAPLPTVHEPEMPVSRQQNHVLADIAVVGDVNQVVDLRSPADSRLFERTAVDGGVGADLHVVFNHQRPCCGNCV
jgi:hypothetical protein